ncbi:MAG: hypothetical protein AB1297_03125 [bacterium]
MENLTTEEATQLVQDKDNWERGGGYLRDLEGISNKDLFPNWELQAMKSIANAMDIALNAILGDR